MSARFSTDCEPRTNAGTECWIDAVERHPSARGVEGELLALDRIAAAGAVDPHHPGVVERLCTRRVECVFSLG